MSEIVLQAEPREAVGKRAKTARHQGLVPGVYYARGENNLTIQVSSPNLDPLIRTSETHIIDLRLKDGTSKKCILRDVQYDPVTDMPIHFDLQGLKENEKLTIDIPIVLTGGTPKGVKDGGILQHMVHRLKISCLPRDIPDRIQINVAELEINRFVHVRDLNIPNVTILEGLDTTLAGVLPPALVKEAETAAPTEEVAAEPEVIGKGKKVEEGEEGEEPAKGEKGEGKAAAKPEAKGAVKPEAKGAAKTEAKPAGKSEAKPAGKEEKKK